MSEPWAFSGQQRLRLDVECAFEPPPRLPTAGHIRSLIDEALAQPLGAPPLRELARGAARVVIAVPDASRSCPNFLVLPAILDELNAAGVGDDRVSVAVACGLHDLTSADEKVVIAGKIASSRLRVFDAQGIRQPNAFLGQTRHFAPAFMNLAVARADLVIALGTVEPHLYAGFSGGAKTVGIGCAGQQTIAWTHHPVFLTQPGIELGRLDGNPFQIVVREIASRTRLGFAVNLVMNEQGKIAALAAGEPSRVQEALVADHRHAWFRTVQGPFDLIVAGIPHPKHANLYQASRAATYIGLDPRPPLIEDGLILLCTSLPDGNGNGPGERNFAALLAGVDDPRDLVARGLREPLGPGGQRAFMMARVLSRFRVGVLGGRDQALVEALGMLSFASVEQAIEDARRVQGHAPRILVVADALDTIVQTSG